MDDDKYEHIMAELAEIKALLKALTLFQPVPGTTLPKSMPRVESYFGPGYMPVTYPEAGEHLVHEPSDEHILLRDNKQCRRCGRYYLSRNGRSRNARHLSVVTLRHDLFNLIAGDRVTLCRSCKRIVEGG